MLVRSDLERLTARVFANRAAGARLDAYREDGTFFIDIDLPGADRASVDITVDDKVLTVRAERRREESGSSTGEVRLSERLDCDRLEAHYENGVLTLRIPVVEQ
ncbi:Hsp20/alpha crystallin family protein [Actinoplanes sp. NPDC051861]|uniref:Hsp20/alpha crystallin family protein n=1 Tax=Actinoplanes sp. NPDC051861 TaxID=3155170 RepID=UPI003429F525